MILASVNESIVEVAAYTFGLATKTCKNAITIAIALPIKNLNPFLNNLPIKTPPFFMYKRYIKIKL